MLQSFKKLLTGLTVLAAGLLVFGFGVGTTQAADVPFIVTVDVKSGSTVNLGLVGGTINSVDWGNGTTYSGPYTDETVEHTYNSTGQYDVEVFGEDLHLRLKNVNGSDSYVTDVKQWGDVQWSSMARMFKDNNQIEGFSATDTPDLSQVTSMERMFNIYVNYRPSKFNGSLSGRDVSNVTNMGAMFRGATVFNGSLSGRDVSNVTTMGSMFDGAGAFDQDISDWNVANVTDMNSMFSRASSFNQDLSDWNVANVTGMALMFYGAENFNSYLSDWDVSNVTSMSRMFEGAGAFDQDLSSWKTSNVTKMDSMFRDAAAFSSDISNWETSNVTNMNSMFRGAENFNSDLSDWDVSRVEFMSHMFRNASSFNHDIGSWNISNVSRTTSMFEGASAFDQDISSWEPSNVVNMNNMFSGASAFNQDLSSWCVPFIGVTPDGFDTDSGFVGQANKHPDRESSECALNDDIVPLILTYIGSGEITLLDSFSTPGYSAIIRIDRGDGTIEDAPMGEFGNRLEHDYGAAYDEYDIKIYAERLDISGLKIISDVKQRGSAERKSMQRLFDENKVISGFSATDLPANLEQISNMGGMFRSATNFTQDLSHWCLPLITTKPTSFDAFAGFEGDTDKHPNRGCVVTPPTSSGGGGGYNIPSPAPETPTHTVDDDTPSTSLSEIEEAYERAHARSITTMPSFEEARVYDGLTRAEFAKMMINYAQSESLGNINNTANCEFSDLDQVNSELANYAVVSCQYGLMGQDTNGIFKPNNTISRAEVVTVLSRLYGRAYDAEPYYINHMDALLERGYITQDTPDLAELRGYMFIMLQRIAEDNE